MIRLNNSVIPTVPFLWYREQELSCPVDYIKKISKDEFIKKVPNVPTVADDCYIVIQEHILDNKNVYICNHSFAFVSDPHNNEIVKKKDIPKIPTSFIKNYNFRTYCELVDLCGCESKMIECPSGLKNKEIVDGSVFIHGGAFSPPGQLHFMMDTNSTSALYVNARCDEINVEYSCLFILINNTTDENISKNKDMINKLMVTLAL